MQLEFDFGPIPSVEHLFFMTSGLFTNEICYTTKTDYGNAAGYTSEQAIRKLLKYGYTKKAARSLLTKAKKSQKWIVYNYQQNLCF